jgi:hypothetical protein
VLEYQLKELPYEHTVFLVAYAREKAAFDLIFNETQSEENAVRWISMSYLCLKIRPNNAVLPNEPLFVEIMYTAEEIVRTINAVERLRKGGVMPIAFGGGKLLVATESEVLTNIPAEVHNYYLKEYGDAFKLFGKEHRGINSENLFFRGMMLQPMIEVIRSWAISSNLSKVWPHRFLPFLIDEQSINDFREISMLLASFVSVMVATSFSKENGLLKN